MEDIFSKLAQEAEEAEKELCKLMDRMDTEALLSVMIIQLLMGPVEYLAGDKFGKHPALIEILAANAIPRFGRNYGQFVNLFDSNQCYSLAEKILNGRMRGTRKTSNASDTQVKLDALGDQLMMQSEIVRGSAYPEQTRKEIDEIQGHFDSWFKNKIGVSPSKATEIIFSLLAHMESVCNSQIHEFISNGDLYKNKFNSINKKKKLEKAEKEFLETFLDEKSAGLFGYFSKLNELVPKLLPINIENLTTQDATSKQEADSLKSLIGVSKKTITENTEIQRFPLYVLNSGEVILSEVSNCLDVLWDGFESVAKSEDKFYQRYQKHKAKWLENNGRIFLERIFPPDSIYETLDYSNPDKDGTAELDLAIKWGPFLLLIEAKAKQFRFESLRGDIGRLRTDLKENIEDAYVQSARAARYINTEENAVFIERYTGRRLELNRNSICKIYPISLSLHHLAGVATQLNKACELGLFKDKLFPFSICIADLDCITKTNITPDIFLHYIERRLAALNATEEWMGDELDLFSAYLDSRLDLKNMPISETERVNLLSFGGYSENFERLAMNERGEIENKPNICISLPDQILELLQQLRIWNDDWARFISFALLDLDNDILNALAKAISEIRKATIKPGVFRRCSFANKETVISVIGSSLSSSAELRDRTIYRTEIEKYRRKVNKSIGIGILCNSYENKSIFHNAQYIEYEWEENAELKDIIESEPAFLPVDRSNLPGRNEPCICGSGIKYKKCCLRKIEKIS